MFVHNPLPIVTFSPDRKSPIAHEIGYQSSLEQSGIHIAAGLGRPANPGADTPPPAHSAPAAKTLSRRTVGFRLRCGYRRRTSRGLTTMKHQGPPRSVLRLSLGALVATRSQPGRASAHSALDDGTPRRRPGLQAKRPSATAPGGRTGVLPQRAHAPQGKPAAVAGKKRPGNPRRAWPALGAKSRAR